MLNQFTGEWQFSQLGEVIGEFNRAIELDATFPTAYQGLSHAGSRAQVVAAAESPDGMMAALQVAGWRPSLATERKAV